MRSIRTGTMLLSVVLIAAAASAGSAAEPRKIEVVAHKFAFEPATIELALGEPVEITFRSTDTKHGFAQKELGLEKIVFSKEEPVTVRFTPEKTGSYPFKCAKFCGLGHGKMKGEIVVK